MRDESEIELELVKLEHRKEIAKLKLLVAQLEMKNESDLRYADLEHKAKLVDLNQTLSRHQMLIDDRERLFKLIFRTFLILLIFALGTYGYMLSKQIIEYDSKKLGVNMIYSTPPSTSNAPPGEIDSSLGIVLLQKTIATQQQVEAPRDDASKPRGGVISNNSKTLDISFALNLIDNLISVGLVSSKDASDIKKEFIKAAISGGKEITVEAAKKILDKMIDTKGATGSKIEAPLSAFRTSPLQVTLNCEKTGQSVPRLPKLKPRPSNISSTKPCCCNAEVPSTSHTLCRAPTNEQNNAMTTILKADTP